MKLLGAFASGLIVGGLVVGTYFEKSDFWRRQGHTAGWLELYLSLQTHFGNATDAEKKASTAFIDYKDARICIVEVNGVKTVRIWRD